MNTLTAQSGEAYEFATEDELRAIVQKLVPNGSATLVGKNSAGTHFLMAYDSQGWQCVVGILKEPVRWPKQVRRAKDQGAKSCMHSVVLFWVASSGCGAVPMPSIGSRYRTLWLPGGRSRGHLSACR